MNELDEFLELNNIDGNRLLESVYLDIKEIILKAVCEKLKNDHDFYIKAKKIFFSNSDLEATGKIVYMASHYKLSEKDTIWMMNCIKAFLGKNERRRTISLEEKKEILYKQNNKCKICGNYIDISNLHVDHIIPWDYVGDKLPDNFQGLCPDCNWSKGNHVAIAVKNIILHTEARVNIT